MLHKQEMKTKMQQKCATFILQVQEPIRTTYVHTPPHQSTNTISLFVYKAENAIHVITLDVDIRSTFFVSGWGILL